MLPADAVDAVRRWAEAKTPAEFRHRMRVDVEVGPRSITILDSNGSEGRVDWLQVPVAKLGWSGTTGMWTLYRFDSNSRAHRYEFLEPNPRVQDLLNEIDDDPTFIFWG